MENNVRAILDGLNNEQREAVENTEGPVLIVAGAGSGKTRVLTSRIAYILSKGTDASRVMALTFTKKAAGEMKERIALMVGPQKARHLVMGTFHSVFIRFLREYSQLLGYPQEFTIYDTSDSQNVIKACVKQLGLDDKVYKPREVLSRISMAKNNLITAEAYANNAAIFSSDRNSRKPETGRIYKMYQATLLQSGVMDFDDILVNMNILLRDHPEALESIASRFSYIMVDEYQDTNWSQYIILKKLSQFHRNICVVGDDSQSIYAFRGAKIENILNFRKDYPESRTFRLERNYRSTRTIVDAANSVIEHNDGRIPKKCYSEGEKGDLIKLLHSYTEQEEAILVVSELLDIMRRDSAKYCDFAILYRTNAQSRVLEEILRRRNLPYMIYSGNSFFERAEVKDLMACFKLVVNPSDDESFRRTVNKPARGIGDTSMSALAECARAHGCPLFQAAFQPDTELYGLRPAALEKIKAYCLLIDSLAAAARTSDAFEMASRIADKTGMYAFYKADTSIEGLSRLANIDELLNSVQAYVEDTRAEMLEEIAEDGVSGDNLSAGSSAEPLITLGQYLENVSLLSNVDVRDEDESNRISLMTVHSAKGLEYPYVFVTGLEENLFPSGGFTALKTDIEEERRLFYVAVTRAARRVCLSFAESRMRNGQHESNPPSRFIKEIDSRYISNPLDDSDFDPDPEDHYTGLQRRFGSFGGGSSFGSGSGSSSRGGYSGGGYRGGSSYQGSGRTSGPSFGGSGKVQYFKKGDPHAVATPQPARPVVTTTPNPALSAPKPDVIDPLFVAVPMTELYAGERIEHNRFGAGLIKSITGTVPELKAVIAFDQYGEKTLLLKYAKLRPEK